MDQSQFKAIVEQILTKTVNKSKTGSFTMRGYDNDSSSSNGKYTKHKSQYKDELEIHQSIFDFDIDDYDSILIWDLIKYIDKLDETKLIKTIKDRIGNRSQMHEILVSLIEKGKIKIIKSLLNDGSVDPGDDYFNMVQLAVAYKNIEMVKLLLADERADPTINNNRAIIWAGKFGSIEMNLLLLDWAGKGKLKGKRVDPRVRNNQAIIDSVRSNSYDVTKLFIDWVGKDDLAGEKINPSAQDNLAIMWANNNNNKGIIKLLLSHENFDENVGTTETLKLIKSVM